WANLRSAVRCGVWASGASFPRGDEVQQPAGDFRKRKRFGNGAAPDGRGRHAIDNRGALILRNGPRVRGAKIAETSRAVFAHAGENHAEGGGAEGAGGG